MLPFCNSCPIHRRMIHMPLMMAPMLPMPSVPAPVVCPPSNINMSLSTTVTNEYDSHLYGRFRHIEQDHPSYRHIPFNWYQSPKQRHNVVHEDVAIITLDGPVSLDKYYRSYIYGSNTDDSDSYESEEYDEPLYEQTSTGHRRLSREESDFSDDEEDQQYSRFNPNRRPIVPPRRYIQPSNYSRNRSLPVDDDFNDLASVDSTYAN